MNYFLKTWLPNISGACWWWKWVEQFYTRWNWVAPRVTRFSKVQDCVYCWSPGARVWGHYIWCRRWNWYIFRICLYLIWKDLAFLCYKQSSFCVAHVRSLKNSSQLVAVAYGCSFVAKLSWKQKFFWENICILHNVHYLSKKCFYMEKNFDIEFFFCWEKNFLQRKI